MLTERVLDVAIAGVPAWFIRLIPLETPGVSALVMSGWTQAGSLYIEGHPGYAYKTLWETAVRTTGYFLLTGLAVMILGGIGMRLLLRPLKMVEQQAEALCRGEYEIQETLPRTRELRQVVESMNRMTVKVREMFTEQAGIAERMRKSAYSDLVTGLGNRRYMKGQVQAELGAPGINRGTFMLVHIHQLQAINDAKGFAGGDELLKKVGAILTEVTLPVVNVALARLSGGDFAVFMPEIDLHDAEQIARETATGLARLAVEQIGISDNLASVGAVAYEGATSFSQLLSEADTALQAARQQGPNQWLVQAIGSVGAGMARGKTWWKNTLDNALQNREIKLLTQPVVMSGQVEKLLHLEVLSRVALTPDTLISAGVFIPLAERLHLIVRLDRLVLEKVFAMSETGRKTEKIAVNVSPTSLEDPVFRQWLLDGLKQGRPEMPGIVFEFIEFSAIQHLETVRGFAESVRQLGHSIGLDHFGQSFANFGYLKSLQPEYVKIDRAYTDELEEEQGDSRFFVGALCSAAHSLDIMVIAEGVEKEAQRQVLLDLNIDGIQGYLTGAPEMMQG